jgi:hypothetical protein
MISRAFLLALLCLGYQVGARANEDKTALVLYDGGLEFKSIQLTDRGIDSALSTALSSRVSIFLEYLELTRVRPADTEAIATAARRGIVQL